ncbi:MAG: M48 family metalloprotease, partial [Spirochaetes bacterium]|nr:M48 family metalloprotease [Spirochaetota bacterium]
LYTERQELEYYFAILATDKVNAYALPGGYILVSLGVIKRIEEPGALVGILAHELGHINLRHILKQIKIKVRYNFFEILAKFLAGPRQIVTNMASQISNKIEEKLFIEGLSCEDEFEADIYSVKLMQALNISPIPYIEYLKKLGEEKGAKALEVLDKTHPGVSDRINMMEQCIVDDLPIMKASEDFIKFKESIKNIKVVER